MRKKCNASCDEDEMEEQPFHRLIYCTIAPTVATHERRKLCIILLHPTYRHI